MPLFHDHPFELTNIGTTSLTFFFPLSGFMNLHSLKSGSWRPTSSNLSTEQTGKPTPLYRPAQSACLKVLRQSKEQSQNIKSNRSRIHTSMHQNKENASAAYVCKPDVATMHLDCDRFERELRKREKKKTSFCRSIPSPQLPK